MLFGQVLTVFRVVIAGVWSATQRTAAAQGYQLRLGTPWFDCNRVFNDVIRHYIDASKATVGHSECKPLRLSDAEVAELPKSNRNEQYAAYEK